MSMSFSPPSKPGTPALDDVSSRIRATTPSWEGFRSAKIISEAEFALIRQFDKQEPFVQNGLLERDGERYGYLFLTLLTKIKTEENVQYTLTLIDDIITENADRIKLFANTASIDEALPYGPLLKCLERDNTYITHKASKMITTLLCATEEHTQAAVGALQQLLTVDVYRNKFFETPDGVSRLVDILRNRQPNFQTQYQVIFCLWLLSFSKVAAEALNKWKVVTLLVDTIRASLKEKVIRIALATLRPNQNALPLALISRTPCFLRICYTGLAGTLAGRGVGDVIGYQNMLEKAPEANLGPLMDAKLLNLCQVLAGRKWTDEDIVADIEFLTTELQKNAHELTYVVEGVEMREGLAFVFSRDVRVCQLFCWPGAYATKYGAPGPGQASVEWGEDMLSFMWEKWLLGLSFSSFEEYAAEVRSNKLEWTPMHRSDAFWKQNAQRLNEQNYELLRVLARLLSTSTDPLVLAVAAHDIGEYVNAYPRGKRVIQELGAKQRIMELMSNENAAVRYEALLSTQKFMVNNWEYLSKSAGGGAAASAGTAQASS